MLFLPHKLDKFFLLVAQGFGVILKASVGLKVGYLIRAQKSFFALQKRTSV